jgi:hypothetical protein
MVMVVGASLARAFGIVGAAELIRYRAKVEDPKDAGVMLSTLAIGWRQVFQHRRIPYEFRSTATEGICYAVKLPLEVHTDTISEALISLKPVETVDVKWEQQKQTK